jgi:predicted permease
MVVQAAMPCAVFPIVLARHFDGSPEIALKVVLTTTILSLITIPLWIAFGLHLLDL